MTTLVVVNQSILSLTDHSIDQPGIAKKVKNSLPSDSRKLLPKTAITQATPFKIY